MNSLLALRHYFAKYRLRLILGLFFVLASNAAATWVPWLIKETIDGISSKDPEHPLVYYVVLIAAAGLIAAVCRYFIRITLIVMSRLIEYDLRQDLWSHIQRLPMRYFAHHSPGSVMAYLTNDVNAVRMFLGPSVMYTIDHVSRLLMTLFVMWQINWQLTLIGLIPMPLLTILVWVVGHRIHSQFNLIQESFSKLTARAQQTFHGIRVIKSYVREDHEYEAFETASTHYRDMHLKIAKIEAFYRPLLWTVPATSSILVLWVGGRMVINGSTEITMGGLLAFMIFLGALAWPMIALGWIVNVTQRAAASMKRLQVLQAEAYEILSPDSPTVPAPDAEGVPAIQFEGVSFRFGTTDEWVLRDIDLTVMPGETLAIVGRTGAGKTCLVNLIPRLYDAEEGTIRVDGVSVRDWSLEELRQRVSIAPQEAFLFSESLGSNLGYGRPEATSDDREGASRTAQLHKDVEDFPVGYETMLGERGITLSGGQKQRASLARALLRQPPILILDDTLSAVDAETEAAILHGLRDVRNGSGERACVIISHRLSAVQDADLIIVLEDGAIVERGNHAELLALAGRYADMYERQRLEHELDVMN